MPKLKTVILTIALVGFAVAAAYAGNCTTNCYRIGNQTICNSSCY